ncbi:hypothetical protein Asi02nite_24790 [Asanoa siamensis]|uniref:Uncharacterized protein n=1 Tax=Asanoa siamensis TaxID=926357 RepID=A0ABQ4CNV7_9ACTN|nr:hypothetical protein Asi02nite_24790 [Asanoa siamensis]
MHHGDPGAPAHPHAQDLPGEGAAATTQAVPPATTGARAVESETRTIGGATPTPRGSRHVVLQVRIGSLRRQVERPPDLAVYTIAQMVLIGETRTRFYRMNQHERDNIDLNGISDGTSSWPNHRL